MKSLEVYTFKKKNFTLVELIMVMGILALLTVISLPLAINFYRTRQLDVHENGIVQVLRRAQLKAMSVEDDSSFGVYITPDRYVLFKGDSYSARDFTYDEIYELPSNLSVSGISEIVFSRLRGVPSNTGNIILAINNKSEIININELGTINY